MDSFFSNLATRGEALLPVVRPGPRTSLGKCDDFFILIVFIPPARKKSRSEKSSPVQRVNRPWLGHVDQTRGVLRSQHFIVPKAARPQCHQEDSHVKGEQQESSVDVQAVSIDHALIQPHDRHDERCRDEQRRDLPLSD